MSQLVVSTWANVNEGCPITCTVSGSNQAHLWIGGTQFELDFDVESMRALVSAATAALAEMDARYERETAEWEAEQSLPDNTNLPDNTKAAART